MRSAFERPSAAPTLLEQYMSRATVETQFERVSEVKPPGLSQRLSQCLIGVAGAHVALALLTAMIVISLPSLEMDARELPAQQPAIFAFLGVATPLLAIALSIATVSRGVYLAQLVGIGIGLATATLVLLERWAVGMPTPSTVLLALPALGPAVGFVVGLRVAGELTVLPAFEFKPIDAWDKKSRPKSYELDIKGATRWRKIVIAVVVGYIVQVAYRFALLVLLRPMYGHNSKYVVALLAGIDPFLEALVLAGAGMIAGAGTRHGVAQGLWCGVGLTVVNFLASRPDTLADGIVTALTIVIPAMVGGVIGRYVFRPTRVYCNVRDFRV